MWLALRSIAWTIVVPGVVAGYVPWRYLGLSRVRLNLQNPIHLLGLACVSTGAVLLGICIWEFATMGRGTLAPVDPPRRLVVRGLYQYVRNPMYVGVGILLLGELMVAQTAAMFWYLLVWFLAVNLFVLSYEEPALRRTFGASYDEYVRSVNRWLPSLPSTLPRDSNRRTRT
jgi:protein-S-isoprenylcysteine O-methyltransferase Ste14